MSSEIVTEVEADQPPPPPPVERVDDDEVDVDEEVEPESKIPKLGAKGSRLGQQRETKAMAELRNNTDTALKEWMESLSPNGGVKVRVTRTSPKIWKGLNVGGSLATYDHYIDEDWIREHHGGGNFMLEVKKPRTNGAGWQIAGSRAISIAGDPRTDDVFRDNGGAAAPAAAPAAGSDSLAKAAFASMERQLERVQQAGVAHGMDPAMIQAIMAPLQAQITQLGQMLRDSQAALALAQQQQSRPPERDEFREKMMSAMIDGDSARMVSMRTQHDSEIRQLKQSAIDTEARLRDSFERDKQMISMAHERELNALRSAYDMKVASQETMNATSKTLLEGEIRRLQADLTEAKSELAALRLKKDKTILEQATEFAAIKDAIGEITGEEKEEKSVIAQVVEAAGAIPAVQNALGKLGGEQPTAAPTLPPGHMVQQPLQLFQGPDGHLYRRLPNGELQLVRRRPQRPQQAAATDQAAAAPQVPEIAPATVKIAVDFLESAFRNGQDPNEVATSVRSMVPGDVIAAIKQLGIDGFLEKVARLDSTSPLSTQAGRNWTRKLGKALVGDA